MPLSIDPKEAKAVADAAPGLLEAARNTWQFLLGLLASGAYGIWKYLDKRMGKLEESLVTSAQLREHTEIEEKKFDALFRMHGELLNRVNVVAEHVAEINGRLKSNGQ